MSRVFNSRGVVAFFVFLNFKKGVIFMSTITEIFSSNVFDESVMKARLPKETFKQVQLTIKKGKRLDTDR